MGSIVIFQDGTAAFVRDDKLESDALTGTINGCSVVIDRNSIKMLVEYASPTQFDRFCVEGVETLLGDDYKQVE